MVRLAQHFSSQGAHRHKVLVSGGPLSPWRRRFNYDYISAGLRPLSQGSRVLRNSFHSFRRPSMWLCHAFGLAPRQPERCLAGNQHLIERRESQSGPAASPLRGRPVRV